MSNHNTKAILKNEKLKAKITRQFKRGEIEKEAHDTRISVIDGYISRLKQMEATLIAKSKARA